MTDTRRPSHEARVEVHELPFARSSNAAARALLATFLDRQRLDIAVLMDASIVLGELVANGLDHGCPDRHDGLEVSWRLDEGGLSLSVLDGGGGETVPHVLTVDQYAPRGRGLAMVQKLARSWTVDTSGGTRVTAVLPLPPTGQAQAGTPASGGSESSSKDSR